MERETHNVVSITREKAEAMIASADATKMLSAFLSLAYYEADPEWVTEVLHRFTQHADKRIRGMTLRCFALTARFHGFIKHPQTWDATLAGMKDREVEVRDEAWEALQDLLRFSPEAQYVRAKATAQIQSANLIESLKAFSAMCQQEEDAEVAYGLCLEWMRSDSAIKKAMALQGMRTILAEREAPDSELASKAIGLGLKDSSEFLRSLAKETKSLFDIWKEE